MLSYQKQEQNNLWLSYPVVDVVNLPSITFFEIFRIFIKKICYKKNIIAVDVWTMQVDIENTIRKHFYIGFRQKTIIYSI